MQTLFFQIDGLMAFIEQNKNYNKDNLGIYDYIATSRWRTQVNPLLKLTWTVIYYYYSHIVSNELLSL